MTERIETVLFAARDLEWAKALQPLLEKEGIRVLMTNSTRETLARAKDAAPGIVVVDKDLEPIATSTFLDALRSCAMPPEIILVSADLTLHSDELQKSMGLLYYAVKPVDVFRLFDVIASGLRRRRLSSDPAKNRHALILCVDDDSLYLSSLSRILTRHGYRVFLCNSAARAMASLPDVRPDLAIIDIMLPGTDGLSLTESIRSWSNGRIPVVLLSALSSDEVYYEGHVRGAQSFLSKPCPQEEVLRVVDSILETSSLAGRGDSGE
jgi:DNA-binding response OmpR family regulator